MIVVKFPLVSTQQAASATFISVSKTFPAVKSASTLADDDSIAAMIALLSHPSVGSLEHGIAIT
jgi:hypothetical protein